jgi:hypothetical protein
MNPTLCEPEIVEVVPSGAGSYRVGDVICFRAPEAARLTVHRIIHINPDGITTRGDNNPAADPFLLRTENIKGRVVAALHGRRRRRVAGGVHGRCISRWLYVRRMLDRSISPRLHPLYRALAQKGRFAGWLPKSHRPRVVRFRLHGREAHRLLLGDHQIGYYDSLEARWEIRRPFRLLVDEGALSRPIVPEDRTGKLDLVGRGNQ